MKKKFLMRKPAKIVLKSKFKLKSDSRYYAFSEIKKKVP